ncbi:hypothetical protein BKM31_31000 [[Actinomadura] parvosata subsp. kistnae]|uniref:Uncharacterized protein n=1 Tax=[Actinomadura] parvosata subsp. kistnae TaxID=1909395 RepID=A0A1V0A4Y7_9ACTN|nr:hypothetical protein [Nonomuraea sp. ATCC 55076]AQZ65286.1 hypothetical protein BKM31_31000 [Nonomuraea sp. ATCC 55076]
MASAGAPEPLTGHADERRRRRGLALRISILLLGVLHLVLAAVLIALPGRTPAFDPLPTPDASGEPNTERRIAAITPHPASAPASLRASSPVRPATSTSATPEAATSASSTAQATPRPSPVRTRGSVAPSGGQEASKPVPAIAPSAGNTTKTHRPARTPSPAIAPAPEVVPPGRTREPPGRVRGSGPGQGR